MSPVGAPGTPSPQAGAPAPAGTIQGAISGRIDLVEEIVVLGPDSALHQFARIKMKGQGNGTYSISGAPPGRYHIMPMGKGGASLKMSPPIASVMITGTEGGRADFTIEGQL